MKLLAGDFVPGSGNKILAGTERRRSVEGAPAALS
jgi:hypothetical protein